MQITFDPTQNQTNHTKAASQAKPQKAAEAYQAAGAYMVDTLGAGAPQNGVFSYGKEKSLQEVQDQASMMDGADYKNYLAVMSHTMSEEDYRELTKDGVNPGKVEVGDAVTIMDHIKANMAEAGVVIEGFNGEGDLSVEELTQMTGSAGYANAIVSAFSQNDIPLTEENVRQVIEAGEQAEKITEISDDVKQYLIENDLPATIDQVYKATYSVAGTAQQSQGGYFADDTTGYYGKISEEIDEAAIADQVEKMLSEADIEVTEETKRQAYWLLEKGILLTEDHMEELMKLDELSLPMEPEELLGKLAGAIREGKTALDASLTDDGVYEKAQEVFDEVQAISDESLAQAVREEKPINIRTLSRYQREITYSYQENSRREVPADGSDRALDQAEAHGAGSGQSGAAEASSDRFLHERRMLEEVRLKMTVSANIMLLKSGFAIDTEPLSKLVDALREAEQRQSDMGLALPEAEQTQLYRETMEKRSELYDMPAAALPRVLGAEDVFTLRALHEQGSALKSTLDKAGESYEALMTKPRADLGDRMRDAFGNIDELLSENGMEPSEENRRAVRILAYNQMEINEASVEKVSQADQMVQDLLKAMTPAKTLQMIRDGVNPLDQTVEEITDYLVQQESDLTEQAEKFSRFLYRMEQENSISPEERASFIGIYRLIAQVEKQDGKAIGRVVADDKELSFANLLSAVRTGQKKPMDIKIDDAFGVLSGLETKGVSIADQIGSYFEFMRRSEQENGWQRDDYQTFRQQLESAPEYVDALLESKQIVTLDNLATMKELTENRGGLYKSAKAKLSKEGRDGAKEAGEAFDRLIEKVQTAFTSRENAQAAATDMAKEISRRLEDTMYAEDNSYLDIKAISAMSKQLSLVASLSQEETYEIPAVIDGELTSASVKFVHSDDRENPNARITVSLSEGRQIIASFMQDGDKVTGYIGCNDEALAGKLSEKQKSFSDSVLSETGKEADITVIKSDVLSQTEQGRRHPAGKQMMQNDRNQAKEDQGGSKDAGALYKTVRAFLQMVG